MCTFTALTSPLPVFKMHCFEDLIFNEGENTCAEHIMYSLYDILQRMCVCQRHVWGLARCNSYHAVYSLFLLSNSCNFSCNLTIVKHSNDLNRSRIHVYFLIIFQNLAGFPESRYQNNKLNLERTSLIIRISFSFLFICQACFA